MQEYDLNAFEARFVEAALWRDDPPITRSKLRHLSANDWLLATVLRNEWQFQGAVVRQRPRWAICSRHTVCSTRGGKSGRCHQCRRRSDPPARQGTRARARLARAVWRGRGRSGPGRRVTRDFRAQGSGFSRPDAVDRAVTAIALMRQAWHVRSARDGA